MARAAVSVRQEPSENLNETASAVMDSEQSMYLIDNWRRVMRRTLLPLSLILCLSSLVQAQRDLKVIPDPDAEQERATFVVPDGVEVNLFAADPRIAKPIQMNFDSKGRLWIASSEVYPHIKPGQKPTDKVLVLEDKDSDGRADTAQVFAEGLLIPTGVLPGHDGVYVANSTELLHFRDTDGDGKADQQSVVLSGFGTEDTHHILHTLRWGRDGCLYMNQSIYIHSHIETPWGPKRLNGGGIWRLRPETLQLEVYARGFVNTWGHQFDQYGQSFATDGAGGEGINFVVQGAAYPTAVGVPRILHGLNPGSPKHCGLEVVDGRHLPDSWQGSVVTNDFRGHRVCRFELTDDGSGFASRQQVELIKSSHPAFRPIDIKMGPDGAIYIADWYNPIIQHGEVDFRDERRDHTHGRIWRLTFKDRELVKRPQFAQMSVEELLEQLKAPESWTRQQAQRVLIESEAARDGRVAKALDNWVAALDRDDAQFERNRLEALWLYQAILQPREDLLTQCMQSEDPRIRAASMRVATDWLPLINESFRESIADATEDTHPRVRLEAVSALRKQKSADAVEHATRALSQPMDRFLEYALWLTCWENQADWLPAFQQGELQFGQDPQRLAFAIKAVGRPGTVRPLVRLFESGAIPEEDRSAVLKVIAVLGDPSELGLVYQLALKDGTNSETRAELLSSLASVARSRSTRPQGDLNRVLAFMSDEKLRSVAIDCAGAWKLEAAAKGLSELARDGEASEELRRQALASLAEIPGDASTSTMVALASRDTSDAVQGASIALLADRKPGQAASLAAKFLSESKNLEAGQNLVASFLRRKGGAGVLGKAIDGAKLEEDMAKIGLRAINESGRSEDGLAALLRAAGGITTGPRELSPAQMQTMVADVRSRGNAQRGEEIFRRAELTCLNCHAIGGAGGKVGPDMVSIGASAQVDYLVESILNPNKKVKENYHTIIAALDNGQVVTGIKVRQTDTELVLRDAKDNEQSIPLDMIDEQAEGISMMPAGLTEKLTRDELVDLVAFMSALGRVEEFSVSRKPLARRWRVMSATPQAAFRLRRTAYSQAAQDDEAFEWKPVYSRVNGELPLDVLPEVTVRNRVAAGTRGVAFARCELAVTQGGNVELQFGNTKGLTVWMDQKPFNVESVVTMNLSPGTHRLTIAIDRNQRSEPLRIGLGEPQGAANVQFLNGK